MQVTVHCLGAFRELGASVVVDVDGPTVADLRTALAAYLVGRGEQGLVTVLSRSVFAGEDLLLKDHAPIPEGGVSVLPPVAGG